MIRYPIWKIVGMGRGTRYYESEKNFNKYFNMWKSRPYQHRWTAYQFTSEGWKRINKS